MHLEDMVGWLFLLLFLPVVSPLSCYTGIDVEYKVWVNEVNRLLNGTQDHIAKAFLAAVNRHMGLSLTMKKEKCTGICLMAKNLIMPERNDPPLGYVSRCDKGRNCNDFRRLLTETGLVEEVRCCDQELCNLPYPAHIETEQPLSPTQIIKSPRTRLSSKLTSVIPFALPLVVLLFG